jgi:hypothetical protein
VMSWEGDGGSWGVWRSSGSGWVGYCPFRRKRVAACLATLYWKPACFGVERGEI